MVARRARWFATGWPVSPVDRWHFNFDEIVKGLIFTMKRMKDMKGQKIYYKFNFMLFMSFMVV
jgi:hypothetical protein